MKNNLKTLPVIALFLALIVTFIFGCGSGTSGGGSSSSPTPTPTPTPTSSGEPSSEDLFFLHHSVGDGLITGGNMRAEIAAYNSSHGTNFRFWDHGYNSDGLRDPNGNFTGTNYNIPNDNTDPEGLNYLFTSDSADAASARAQILNNYGVIAFKSCFTTAAIPDDATLEEYKNYYLEIRNVFDAHPNQLFVVVSIPPRHRLETNAAEAARAREFANWLKSNTFLGGHNNVVCYDLFDELAGADNFLKYEYEQDHTVAESHPNDLANQTVGPDFAQFLCTSAANFNP